MTTPRIPLRFRLRLALDYLCVILLFPFRFIKNVAYLETIELLRTEIEILATGYGDRGKAIDRLRDSLGSTEEGLKDAWQEVDAANERTAAAEEQARVEYAALESEYDGWVLKARDANDRIAELESELKKTQSTIQVQDLELKLLAGVNQRNFERVSAESAMACRRIAAAKHAGELELLEGAGGGE